MKKIFTLALSAMMLGGVNLSAQKNYTVLEDLTSKIQNADFSVDTPVSGLEKICTYNYDMTDPGLGAGGVQIFGLQPITGWVANFPTDNVLLENRATTNADAKAGGIFAYIDDASEEVSTGLGGAYYAPYLTEEVTTGQGLGIVAVWGSDAQYTQDMTLPAGAYMMLVKVQNTAGGEAFLHSNIGFVAADGTTYVSGKKSFAVGTWETDTIVFQLETETAGKLSLGYKAGNYGSGGAAHLFIDNVKLCSIDPRPLIQAEVDAAKVQLLALIEEAKDYGVDVSAAQAVYNNADATLEQVQKAIENQKKLIEAGLTDLSAFFITNPHFTLGTPLPEDDGICTYDYDMVDPNGSNGRVVNYYGMLPVEGWVPSNPNENARACGVFKLGSNSFLGGAAFLPPTTMSDGSTEGNLLGFISVWSAKSQYTQAVTIPAGKYTLEISYYNAGGAGEIGQNLMGFIDADGNEYFGELKKFEEGKWMKEQIKFELDEETSGQFSVGFTAANAGSGSMPHFFIDGISLYYVGETEIDPSLFALQAAVSAGENLLGESFNVELTDKLDEVVNAGAKLVSSQSADAEANKAAADAINNLLPEVRRNIDAYTKLNEFYDDGGALSNALAEYEGFEPLHGNLLDLNDEVMAAIDEYSWTTAQIEQAIDTLGAIVKDGVQIAWENAVENGTGFDKDLDISILFEQLAYTYSTSALGSADVPDKEWVYGSATNFKTQYGTAEVWNQYPFEVSRTLADMPVGTYTITTKAFFRNAANIPNLENYDPSVEPEAAVFAGYSKTGLTNVAEIALDSKDGWGEVNLSDGTKKYVPNNQKNAYDLFEDEAYTEQLQKSVTTVLTEQGDLTFGVKASEMASDSWVVWYTFSIAYNAVDKDALTAELLNFVAEVKSFIEENDGLMNGLAAQQLLDAAEVAEGAAGKDVAAMSDAKAKLQTAYDNAKANIEVMAKFVAADENLTLVAEEYYEYASAEAQAAYDALEGDVDEMTNEEIEAFIEKLNAVAADLKIPATSGEASDENPVDLTSLIVNPSYTEENSNGWSGSVPNHANYNRKDMVEYYQATFDHYQTIYSLPAGTYEVALNCFNRIPSTNAQADLDSLLMGKKEVVQSAFVYVKVGEKTYSEPFRLISEGRRADKSLIEASCSTLSDSLLVGADAATLSYTPNNMQTAGACFEETDADGNALSDEQNYVVRVVFTLEEKSDIVIGAKNSSNGTWAIWDNWKLTSFGVSSTKTESGDPSFIDGVGTADDATPVAIYTTAGAQVNTLQKGFNIVKFSDGSVKKVLVK
ncbi:MAG: hypothetical protein II278_05025 [Bacteroidaceae bacterium]|nr:hypothetical protein [Bacteroidaceae bacterium]